MNIVIPMAGAGSRFANAGFTLPKPFINVFGAPMIRRVLDNLVLPEAHLLLVIQREHQKSHADCLANLAETYSVTCVPVDGLTEGAACSALHARAYIDNDDALLIANSDQIVDFDLKEYIGDCDRRGLDGSVLTFHDDHPKWSYARIGPDELITDIREKEVVSNFATAGVYYFSKGRDFVDSAIDMIVRNDRVNNEFYVAPAYNYAIASGKRFCIYNIDRNLMHGLGTPEDLDAYLACLAGVKE